MELTIIAQRIDKNFAESKFGLNHRRQNKSNCSRTPYINIRILFAAVDAIIFVLYCFFLFFSFSFFLCGTGGEEILTLFRKPADQEAGGLVSQRTILPELEFRLL